MSIWEEFGLTGMVCPTCDGQLLVNVGAMVIKHEPENQVFHIKCPICSSVFPFGLVLEGDSGPMPGSWPLKTPARSGVTTAAKGSPNSAGGTGRRAMGGGNQPANSMNPNNRASRAAANNRSNQMNPNSAAFRSSRGKG